MPLPVVTSQSDAFSTGKETTTTPTGGQGTATSRTTMETSTRSRSDMSSIPSSTTESTLMTSELLTAQPSGTFDTSISWGPAITAPAIPSTETNGPGANVSQSTGGMSSGGRTTLIATTTIGGTFILAFLIYALWRRRKGATYSEIIRFRHHSSTICLSPGPRNPDFTALPIYRESRYSVRSTKRGSMLSFSKLMQKRAPSPSSESFSKGPWLRNQWKAAHPPTPTRSGHPLSQVMTAPAPPPPVKSPEMAHLPATNQSGRIRINRTTSEGNINKPWPAISTQELPPSRGREMKDRKTPPDSPKSDTHLQDDSRWSWTNSQAPPTPRMRAHSPTRRSSKSSLGSLPRFRKVHSWVRNQSERSSQRIPEEQLPPRAPAKPKLPPLKNKGSKPTLAPSKPTRRLSKKSGPPAGSSSRPTTAVSSQKAEDGPRPKTAS